MDLARRLREGSLRKGILELNLNNQQRKAALQLEEQDSTKEPGMEDGE